MRITSILTTGLSVGFLFVASVNLSPACTVIMVGKKASTDGSVMTSHTCDSHRDGSRISVVPAAKHAPGSLRALTKRKEDDTGPMPRLARQATGRIAEVPETFGYINAVYGIMNQRQVAIGESTFEGREELKSDKGLIDCDTLTQLMLERATTAREAIQLGGALIEKHGWCDFGEALMIADPNEVWVMEIVGPGKDEVGAVWAAQRVPDDHVSVVANGARIGRIDLSKPDWFMASKNVVEQAKKLGYWNPDSGEPFRFNWAYDPENRIGAATTRREWRVLDMLAPSLKLAPGHNDYPFSVKPDQPVGPKRIMEIFRDTYEGTEFDMVKDVTVTDESGKTVKSPLANPFMPYEMNDVLKINGGWGRLGERSLARWYTMYATVIQVRGHLPDEVGGIVWLGYSNTAMTTYVPLYAGITDLPADYKTDGRTTGFSRRSAWWAFNRVATLAAHRWGDMRNDVATVRDPLQEKYLAAQDEVAKEATELLKKDPAKARAYLTRITREACRETTDAYWNLGDLLWTKYDEKW
ncbi:MAG: C69 family dipeptidase [Pirellulales bacterium]|nr:C69 family dipeptidase [Pirellulales bacterium]